MEVAVQLLGPVRLWIDGQERNLGSLKEQEVLALLAYECDRLVPVETMISYIWGDSPPGNVRGNVSSYISRVRRRLKSPEGSEEVKITSSFDAYRLALTPESVDLHRCTRLRRQAAALTESGDDEHAARLLREAEALWHGPALSGLPGPGMDRLRDALQEEHRTLVVDRIETELRLGRHARLLGELRALSARHPLDERIAALLITALYRCDRQADALKAYRELDARLRAELGVGPGARLREIHRQVLSRDLDLAVTPRYRNPGRSGQPDTLPPDPPDFCGREEELAALCDDEDAPVRVIVGMPGVGKTTLAVRAARELAARYPDARLFLNLAAHDPARPPLPAGRALSDLLAMIGVPAPRVPRTVAERAALWRAELADRRAVIVLDDAVDVRQIRPLLPATGSCRVLITARSGMSGLPARHLRLGVLPRTAATTLFARVAGREMDERTHRVVARCDGLPLAIRLAASSIRRAVADGVLAEPAVEDPAAWSDAAGVFGAFDMSYAKLSSEQQRVFRRIGWHPGERISEAAAAHLADRPAHSLRTALAALCDDHLIEPAGSGAYRFHGLIRSYVCERSRREDSHLEVRRTVGRLLAHYLGSAHRADRLLNPHRRRPEPAGTDRAAAMNTAADARDWLDAEWSGVMALAEYAFGHEWRREAGDLAYLVAKFLVQRGLWDQARRALDLALRSARERDDVEAMTRAMVELTFIAFLACDHETALRHATDALRNARRIGDERHAADALAHLGLVHWSAGRYREALAYCEEALSAYRASGDLAGAAGALNYIGVASWHLGRHDQALTSITSALDLYRRLGDDRGVAIALNNLGDIRLSRGYHRDALRLYRECQKIFALLPGDHNEAILHSNIGNVQRYKGDHARALESYRKALAIYRTAGSRRNMADAYNNLGSTYLAMDRCGEALAHHQRALATASEIGVPYERARALLGMALAHRDLGSHQLALERFDAALVLAREMGDLCLEAKVHDGTAGVLLQTRGPGAARIRWRQALRIFRELGLPEAREVEIRLHALGGMAS